MPVQTLDQSSSGLFTAAALPMLIVYIAVALAVWAFMWWAMFEKAGWPGWASLVPLYNVYVLLKIGGMSGWWLIAFFVPILNFIVGLVLLWNVSKAFGHGVGYFFGLWLLSIVFFPILGFGKSEYHGEMHARHSTSGAMPTPA